MSGLSRIGLLTSFGAGVVSFLSPCVLPLVPGYVSYVAGDTLTESGEPAGRRAALRLSLSFVLGFSTVFVVLGASATSIGQFLLSYRYEANLLGGAVLILFGLFMMGLANLTWLQREFRLHPRLKGGHPVAAYLIGIAVAFGWTPCIGPVLGAILTTSAVSATVPQGMALLSPLFAWAGATVSRRGDIHREPDDAPESFWSGWPVAALRGWCDRRRNGRRDTDR
jgi:cytochrome c-type biogenesis protein